MQNASLLAQRYFFKVDDSPPYCLKTNLDWLSGVHFQSLFFLICLVLCFRAKAGDFANNPANVAMNDLTGTYRVKGECAYKTIAEDYNTCTAWNELQLDRLKHGNYAFKLKTNTFSTTRGECNVEGLLQMQNAHYLTGSDKALPQCHLQLQVTKNSIILHVSNTENCAAACGMNASLESAPFPRKLEASKGARCEDGYYYSHDFQVLCAKERYARADKRLNRAYQKTMRTFTLQSREKLRDEQRLWLKSLGTDCEQVAGVRPDTENVGRIDFYDCLAQESERRRKKLERHGWDGL